MKKLMSIVGITVFAVFNSSAIWINEIHYDNDGSDTGEFVEIAGEAGTDLSGWSLVRYNGNGGSSYGTLPLSGSIDNESVGYGALSFAWSGLQNGAPDGVALVDPGNNVIEFLSYEGSFTASSGPANGLTSVDIGVSQPGSTTVGDSLQLTGELGSFLWTGPVTESRGSLNAGQILSVDDPIDESGDVNTVPDAGSTLAMLLGAGTLLSVVTMRNRFDAAW